MATLLSIFPEPRDLLDCEPEDLAAVLMEVIPEIVQPAGFTVGALLAPHYPATGGGYPSGGGNTEIVMALGEALSWLSTQGLIMHNPTQSGDWMVPTRRGRALKTRVDVETFQKGRALPVVLLHPVLIEKVRPLFLRGDYDTAVFRSYKEVEVAVRTAGKYPYEMVGVALMREAFHPEKGQLTNKNLILAERQAEAALFAGAIGHCKNPGSHRDVEVERQEAARLIIFASYLLDLVHRRSIT